MTLTLKKLLLDNENWYRYHQFYSEHGEIRPSVERSINKIISCRHYARGHAHYHCSNTACTHEKRVHFSCKDRGCSACGKVATDKWITAQKELLPRVLRALYQTPSHCQFQATSLQRACLGF